MHRRTLLKLAAAAVPAFLSAPSYASHTVARMFTPAEALIHEKNDARIIVVGAGLAGLSAAYELKQAGYDIVVLEARTQPGGRVRTLRRPFAGDLYAEAGANLIHSTHRDVLEYIQHFNLPLETMGPGSIQYYFVGGKRVFPYSSSVSWPFDLTAEERRLGLAGMQMKYVLPLIKELGDPTSPQWPPERLLKYDAVSFAEVLQQQGASPGAVALLRLGFEDAWGDGINSTSALFVLKQIVHLAGKNLYRISGGNTRLVHAFAQALRNEIRYGRPVVRIEQQEEKVRAICRQGDRIYTTEGDYLICTIPFSALGTVEVSPALSHAKRRAIRELPYTGSTQAYLQFRRPPGFESPGMWAPTDGPLMVVSHDSHGQSGPRILLSSFVTGAEARRLSSMGEAAVLHFTLSHLEHLYPGISAYYEGGAMTAWHEERWARGGYVWYEPGQIGKHASVTAAPEGRIHFAGEHTSAWEGWMEGALVSGVRAAREVQQASTAGA